MSKFEVYIPGLPKKKRPPLKMRIDASDWEQTAIIGIQTTRGHGSVKKDTLIGKPRENGLFFVMDSTDKQVLLIRDLSQDPSVWTVVDYKRKFREILGFDLPDHLIRDAKGLSTLESLDRPIGEASDGEWTFVSSGELAGVLDDGSIDRALDVIESGTRTTVATASSTELPVIEEELPLTPPPLISEKSKNRETGEYQPLLAESENAKSSATSSSSLELDVVRQLDPVPVANTMFRGEWETSSGVIESKITGGTWDIDDLLTEMFMETGNFHDLNLQDVCRYTLELVNRVGRSESGAIILNQEKSNSIMRHFVVVRGPQRQLLEGFKLPSRNGLIDKCINSNQEVFSADAAMEDPVYAKIDRRTGYITMSVFYMPIPYQDRVLGSIEIINKIDGYEWSDDQRAVVKFLAGKLGERLGVIEEFKESMEFVVDDD